MSVKPVPEGNHSVTPYLIVQDAGRLVDRPHGGIRLVAVLAAGPGAPRRLDVDLGAQLIGGEAGRVHREAATVRPEPTARAGTPRGAPRPGRSGRAV